MEVSVSCANNKRQKAQERWKKLKGSLSLVINEVNTNEQDKKLLVQGLRLYRKIKYHAEITDVQFIANRQEYIVISENKAQFLSEDGRKKNEYSFNFTKILHNKEVKRFIGWTEGNCELSLMTMRFEILHTVNCPEKIRHVAFNPCINELIVVCGNYLCVWIFQNGSKMLVLKRQTRVTLNPNTVISVFAVQKSASRLQKCFLASGTDVFVFQVRLTKFLLHKKDLHQRNISAMTYFDPFQILVTGSLDGCIKVWKHNWNVLMVFVSHENRISKLCTFPGTTAQLLSTSSDLTLRVWNLDTQEEVGRTKIEQDIQVLSRKSENAVFYSCSGNTLTIWKMEKIYHFHMHTGVQVTSLKVTNHPIYPQRAIVITNDLTVRLIIPHTAELITKLILPTNGDLKITDAAYDVAEEILFVSLDDASILKVNTKIHPCDVIDTWKYKDRHIKGFTCLVLYEHVVSELKSEEMTSFMRSLTTQTIESGVLTAPKNTNRTILIVGTSDGQICVINWQTGRPTIQIQAHNEKEVLSLVTNVRFDQVISSGKDHVIKIWRFYPFVAECLVPLMSFYCTYTPTQMTIMKNLLCLAFHDGQTLNFSIVAYDLTNSERFDHCPEDDHLNEIIALASCPTMNIFASASLDGTLKLWNNMNKLIKTLHLAACPTSLCFHGNKGDLLIGIGFHLYHIPYMAYLPKSYRIKMMNLMLEEPMADRTIPEDTDKMEILENSRNIPTQTIQRLPVYEDNLTQEETKELEVEKRLKEHAFKVFTDRENDLKMIKEGKYFSSRKPCGPEQKKIKMEAFENYLKVLYDKVMIQVPKESQYYDEIDAKMQGPSDKKAQNELTNSKRATVPGFFPDLRPQYTRPLPPGVRLAQHPHINPNGYLPNSVLIKLLWPHRNLEEEENDKKQHNTEVKKLFSNLKFVVPQEKEKVRPLSLPVLPLIDISSREETPTPEESPRAENSPISGLLKEATISVEKSEVLESVEDLKPVELEKVESVSVLDQREESSVIKYVTRPKSSYAEVTSPTSSTILRISSAPSNPEEDAESRGEQGKNVPPEIRKYQTMDWFKIYFPSSLEDSPMSFNVESFMSTVLSVIPTVSNSDRNDVFTAIIEVFLKYGVGDKTVISETLINSLKKDPLEMGFMNENQAAFVKTAVKNLYVSFHPEDDMVVYLVAYFVHGDRELRNLIFNCLKSMGMNCSTYHLSKELVSWDKSKLHGNNAWEETLKKSTSWLEEWKSRFVDHLKTSLNLLKSGKNIQGHVTREQLSCVEKIQHQKNLKIESRSVTVNLDLGPTAPPGNKVTYIEVINYFCEIKAEDETKKQKPRMKQSQEGINKIDAKNTILMLPPILKHKHLPRLGETHCSHCKAHRETTFYTDFQKPPVSFQSYLPHQSMKEVLPKYRYYTPKVTLDPFPSSDSECDSNLNEPVLVTVRVYPRYFFPSVSIVPPTN